MLQPGEHLTPMARQNVQARVRSERMWTWANSAGALFLQTSNMSEKAVGYVTIGGDGEGALSVIANVPKTVVNHVIDWLHERTRFEGIRLTLLKPASAELAADQEDERDLDAVPRPRRVLRASSRARRCRRARWPRPSSPCSRSTTQRAWPRGPPAS